MIKLNWIIILAIIVFLVFLYINNTEHFAGAVTTLNPEAVRNISSVYNTDNLTATNITASNKLNLNTKFSLSGDADGYFRIKNKDGGQVFAVGQGNDSYLNTLYVDILNAGGGNLVKGPNNNKFVFHTPDDTRKGLWIAPDKGDNTSDWDWGRSLNLKRDGNHELGGNLSIAGNVVSKNLPVSTAKIIPMSGYADPWYSDYYKIEMLKEFKLSDPDGKKVDFLFIHSNADSWTNPKIKLEDATVVYQRYYSAYKYGNRIYFHYLIATGPQGKNDISAIIPN